MTFSGECGGVGGEGPESPTAGGEPGGRGPKAPPRARKPHRGGLRLGMGETEAMGCEVGMGEKEEWGLGFRVSGLAYSYSEQGRALYMNERAFGPCFNTQTSRTFGNGP